MLNLIFWGSFVLFGFNNVSWAVTEVQKTGLMQDHFVELLDAETLKKIDLDEVTKNHSTWVFFQEDCASCHSMMRESACFTKKNNKVFFVGVMSDSKVLLKEARDYKFKGPVLYSKNNIESVLGLNVTPTVFIFKKEFYEIFIRKFKSLDILDTHH